MLSNPHHSQASGTPPEAEPETRDMHITIRTREHGDIDFRMPDRGGYVLVGAGKQICDGGRFRGATVSADPESFARVVRRWHAARMRNIRQSGESYIN